MPPPMSRTASWAVSPQRKRELERTVIGVAALLFSGLFLWMIADFLPTLFLAAVLALLLETPQQMLTEWLGGREKLASCLLVLAAVLAVSIPAALVVGVLIEQTTKFAGLLAPFIKEQIAHIQQDGLQAGLTDYLPKPIRDEVVEYQAATLKQISDLVGKATPLLLRSLRASTGGVGSVLSATLNFLFLAYALLMFLFAGRDHARHALSLVPMPARHRALLAERARSTIRATVKGSFLIALVQGSLTGIGLGAAGVPLSIFWGAAASVCSIIPLIGPPLIWAPAALWLFLSGALTAATGLLAWGLVVVSTSDNLLRPILVGADAKMSDLMVLVSTLGGVSLFGAVGIILGPLIGALFSAVWYVYREAFHEFLDPTESAWGGDQHGQGEYSPLVDDVEDLPKGKAGKQAGSKAGDPEEPGLAEDC